MRGNPSQGKGRSRGLRSERRRLLPAVSSEASRARASHRVTRLCAAAQRARGFPSPSQGAGGRMGQPRTERGTPEKAGTPGRRTLLGPMAASSQPFPPTCPSPGCIGVPEGMDLELGEERGLAEGREPPVETGASELRGLEPFLCRILRAPIGTLLPEAAPRSALARARPLPILPSVRGSLSRVTLPVSP